MTTLTLRPFGNASGSSTADFIRIIVRTCSRRHISSLFRLELGTCVIARSSGECSAQESQTLQAHLREHYLVGREVFVPGHIRDDQEFVGGLSARPTHGRLFFTASWMEQGGGRRLLTKGAGRPPCDPSRPRSRSRTSNRLSANDNYSCVSRHNALYAIPTGAGDFSADVFFLGQRFDLTTADPSEELSTRGTGEDQRQPATLEMLTQLCGTTKHFRVKPETE